MYSVVAPRPAATREKCTALSLLLLRLLLLLLLLLLLILLQLASDRSSKHSF